MIGLEELGGEGSLILGKPESGSIDYSREEGGSIMGSIGTSTILKVLGYSAFVGTIESSIISIMDMEDGVETRVVT